jgi:hypothetical protein
LPANHKVSVAWQIVFTFISILNLWAFYRIRKLRKYLLYVVVPSIITSIAVWLSYDQVKHFTPWGDDGLPFGNPNSLYAFEISILVSLALQALAIYLVIKWSREHNERYIATLNL